MTDYQAAARQAASSAGIDPGIFVNQIQQESGFNPRASSPAGAQGIAQFMPGTAAGMGINPWDALASLIGAARLDKSNLTKYGGDYRKMLAAYNAGGGTVDSAIARGGSNWLTLMPSETQQYVSKILAKGTPPTTSAAASAQTAAQPTTSTSGILATVKQWGEYIAIFALALVLMLIGFVLIAQKETVAAAKTAVKAAVLA